MRINITKAIALLITLNVTIFAQEMGTFKDTRDGKTYKTTKIGSQTWMAENLNYNASGSKCYDNKPENCTTYGRLYNLETAKKACPVGWHLPSEAEWQNLTGIAGGNASAGGKLKTKSGWHLPSGAEWQNIAGIKSRLANGTDEFGFAALPSGSGNAKGHFGEVVICDHSAGESAKMCPRKIGEYAKWWFISSRKYSDVNILDVYEIFLDAWIGIKGDSIQNLNSVRCVQGDAEKSKAEAKAEIEAREKMAWEAKKKEEAAAAEKIKAEVEIKAKAEAEKAKAVTEAYVKANGGTFTDKRDKKTYKTIKINGQVWMAENLSYDAKDSKCYDGKPENCTQYGRLYNWETAMKACPAGWHLPKNAEWDKLFRSVDGTNGTQSPYKSETAGKYLKSTLGWNNNGNKSGNGEDKFGFSALPSGYADSRSFGGVGKAGGWWSGSEWDDLRAYYKFMNNNLEHAHSNEENKSKFFSIRCIKD